MTGGAIEIRHQGDGAWTLSVNGGGTRRFPSLQAALEEAGNVTFAPGEGPGAWRVLVTEP